MLLMIQELTRAETYAETMTPAAWTFLALAWTGVIVLNVFAFRRILFTKRHFDPDGVGPEHSPVPPREDGGA